jgi:PhnB protein
VHLHPLGEFGRSNRPPDAVAHGHGDGPVASYGADALEPDEAMQGSGLILALPGFTRLAEGGRSLGDLAERSWGASAARLSTAAACTGGSGSSMPRPERRPWIAAP